MISQVCGFRTIYHRFRLSRAELAHLHREMTPFREFTALHCKLVTAIIAVAPLKTTAGERFESIPLNDEGESLIHHCSGKWSITSLFGERKLILYLLMNAAVNHLSVGKYGARSPHIYIHTYTQNGHKYTKPGARKRTHINGEIKMRGVWLRFDECGRYLLFFVVTVCRVC